MTTQSWSPSVTAEHERRHEAFQLSSGVVLTIGFDFRTWKQMAARIER